jgi:hypothetical protein
MLGNLVKEGGVGGAVGGVYSIEMGGEDWYVFWSIW